MNSYQMRLENSNFTPPELFMEQINLSTSEENNPFEEELVVNHVNQQLRQESRLKGVVREFTIFNDTHLYQRVKKKHRGQNEFHINLDLVDQNPKSEFTLAYDWLMTTVISSLVTLLMVYLYWFSAMDFNSSTASIMTTLSISFSSIVFLITLLKTDHRIQLFSRYGRVPVVEFINNKPSPAVLSEFIKLLRQHIVQARKNTSLTTKEQLSMELKELRRLHNESVISLEDYEQAKKDILNNAAFKSPSG